VLAVLVGYDVISNVAHALHTPLMSETNAISGVILVGGILQVGSTNPAIAILATFAVLVQDASLTSSPSESFHLPLYVPNVPSTRLGRPLRRD
jgi:NAD/NADP transhydrogenase alpha subunit